MNPSPEYLAALRRMQEAAQLIVDTVDEINATLRAERDRLASEVQQEAA